MDKEIIDSTLIDTTDENSYQEIYDFQQEFVAKALSDFKYTRDCILDGEENLTKLNFNS